MREAAHAHTTMREAAHAHTQDTDHNTACADGDDDGHNEAWHVVSDLKAQLASLDMVVAAMQGRADESAQRQAAAANGERQRLRVQITRTKPMLAYSSSDDGWYASGTQPTSVETSVPCAAR